MAGKKRKVAISFGITSHENKFFYSIKISYEVKNGCLKKREKEMRVFLCNQIAQIISEICDIS